MLSGIPTHITCYSTYSICHPAFTQGACLADTVGARLRAVREHRHLDQKGMAAALGIDQGQVSRLERDKATATAPQLAVIAGWGYSVDWVLTGQGGMLRTETNDPGARAGATWAIEQMEGRLADLRASLTAPVAPTGLDVAALAQLQGVLQPPSEPEPSNGERRHGERRNHEERRKQA
jgi:transcriptional regulator with XRE-family HTH domain